jgi:tripartite-type tricarboxylate transporter receptor subunit TctC
MKLPRRTFLHLATGAAALPTVAPIARAETYPVRPVRILVGFPAGGGADIMARFIGQGLSERLGQQFVVENRPGAGSNIAIEAAVKAPRDGYTLPLISVSAAIGATLYDKLNFNFIRDIAPVASIARVPNIMEVHPSFPAKTVPEFIAYAKANSGKISMASGGVGTSQHVAGELFKMMAGIDMVHVPYRIGPTLYADLLSGRVHVTFSAIRGSIEFIRTGRLRALAVTSEMRSEALADIPTIAEFLSGYEASVSLGLGVPRGTRAEIVEKLNKEINVALTDPKTKASLAALGGTPLPGTPSDFGKFIADETEKWAKVIKFANIKPE